MAARDTPDHMNWPAPRIPSEHENGRSFGERRIVLHQDALPNPIQNVPDPDAVLGHFLVAVLGDSHLASGHKIPDLVQRRDGGRSRTVAGRKRRRRTTHITRRPPATWISDDAPHGCTRACDCFRQPLARRGLRELLTDSVYREARRETRCEGMGFLSEHPRTLLLFPRRDDPCQETLGAFTGRHW